MCRDDIASIEQRTALICQLRAAVSQYLPTALRAFDDWTLRVAWALVEAFPTPGAVGGTASRSRSNPVSREATGRQRLLMIEFPRSCWMAESPLSRPKIIMALPRPTRRQAPKRASQRRAGALTAFVRTSVDTPQGSRSRPNATAPNRCLGRRSPAKRTPSTAVQRGWIPEAAVGQPLAMTSPRRTRLSGGRLVMPGARIRSAIGVKVF